LFAVSTRCRSFSSFSDTFSTRMFRTAAAPRAFDFDTPFRPAAPGSSESSALSDNGDADRELVLCRFVFSDFLQKCQQCATGLGKCWAYSWLSLRPRFGRLFAPSGGSECVSSLLASIALLRASASSYPASLLFNVDRRFEAWFADDPRPFRVSFSLVGERAMSLFRDAARDVALPFRFMGR
jgi:hypothetical protein